MFQSILKKVNENIPADLSSQILSQASAAQTAIEAAAGRLTATTTPTSTTTTTSTTTAALQSDPQSLPQNHLKSNDLPSAAAAVATDADSAAVAAALDRSRAATEQALIENANLKKHTTNLEAQLKDLRLKAKLKITQLQRDLNAAKGSAGASTPTADSTTATPQTTAPASPTKIDSRNPVDIEMIDSLQSKVESLRHELESQKAAHATALAAATSSTSSNNTQMEEAVQKTEALFKSQVESLLEEKKGLLEQITVAQTSVLDISAQKQKLEDRVKKLEFDVSGKDQLIASLKSEHQKLQDKLKESESTTAAHKKMLEDRVSELETVVVQKDALLTSLNADHQSIQSKLKETEILLAKEVQRGIDSKEELEGVTLSKDMVSARFRQLTESTDKYKVESEATLVKLKSESAKLEGRVAELEELVTVLKSTKPVNLTPASAVPVPGSPNSKKAKKAAAAAAAAAALSVSEVNSTQEDPMKLLEAAISEKHNLQTQLAAAQESSISLQSKLDALTLQLQASELAASSTTEKLTLSEESLHVSAKEKESLEAKSEELRMLLFKEKERVSELEGRIQVIQKETEAKISGLQEELDTAKLKVLEVRQAVAEERGRKKSAGPSMSRATSPVRGVDEALEAEKRVVEVLERLKEAQEDGGRRVDDVLGQLKTKEERCEELEAVVASLKDKCKGLEERIENLTKSLEDASKLAADAGDVSALKEELETARLKVVELSSSGRQRSVVSQQATEQQIAELNKRIVEYQVQVKELEDELEEAVSTLNAKSSTDLSIQKQLQEVLEAKKKLEGQLANSLSETSTLKEVLAQKDQDLAEVQNKLAAVKDAEGGRAFSVDEQIMDLKIQIANRQKEVVALNDALQKSKAESERVSKENEEKIRKLKGLLGQASKSLQESKRAVAEKDDELEKLRSELDTLERTCNELKAMDSEHKSAIDRLLIEVQDEKEIAAMKTDEIERQYNELQVELTRVKSEFQSYKVKAHTALQQSNTSAFESKIVELEEINARLMREKLEARQEAITLNERMELTSTELNTALDQLVAFETQLKRYEGSSKELALLRHEVEACNRRIELEKELHAESLRAKDAQSKTAIENLKQDMIRDQQLLQNLINQKDSEIKTLRTSLETIGVELQTARAEASKAVVEAERAKAAAAQATARAASGNFASVLAAAGGASAPVASSPAGSGVFGSLFSSAAVAPSPILPSRPTISSPASSRRESVSLNHNTRETFADLLGKTSIGSDVAVSGSAAKERELLMNFEKVSELLAEAEEEIRRLTQQEQVLKEEIRKKERADMREELLVKKQNVEYLKNIILSFLETDAKEQLLPVVTKVLELSPDEVKRIKSSLMGMEEEKVRAATSFGFF
ncbi:GRIP and coiled-coil domain-containing protein 2 [Rhizoclosmatium sp. JEL0117]|nr:GRIP and coiled-coil domain-containing protein 2 [Rhizoclosmatium sp. JEL0117]